MFVDEVDIHVAAGRRRPRLPELPPREVRPARRPERRRRRPRRLGLRRRQPAHQHAHQLPLPSRVQRRARRARRRARTAPGRRRRSRARRCRSARSSTRRPDDPASRSSCSPISPKRASACSSPRADAAGWATRGSPRRPIARRARCSRAKPAKSKDLRLELKLLADVGLVGFPERRQVDADRAHLRRAAEDRRLPVHDADAEPRRRRPERRPQLRRRRRARADRRRARGPRPRPPVPAPSRTHEGARAPGRRVRRDRPRSGRGFRHASRASCELFQPELAAKPQIVAANKIDAVDDPDAASTRARRRARDAGAALLPDLGASPAPASRELLEAHVAAADARDERPPTTMTADARSHVEHPPTRSAFSAARSIRSTAATSTSAARPQRALGLDAHAASSRRNVPPHRPQPVASAFHRFAMVALAVAGRRRLARLGPRAAAATAPSLHVDTLQRFHERGYRAVRAVLHHRRRRVRRNRAPGSDYPDDPRPRAFRGRVAARHSPVRLCRSGCRSWPSRMAPPAARSTRDDRPVIFLIDAPTADVSSTAIRQRVRSGRVDRRPGAAARRSNTLSSTDFTRRRRRAARRATTRRSVAAGRLHGQRLRNAAKTTRASEPDRSRRSTPPTTRRRRPRRARPAEGRRASPTTS